MSKFVFYGSLKQSAKRAFDKGQGKHGKYVVDGDYIAVVDTGGRALDFVKVVKKHGEPISGKE